MKYNEEFLSKLNKEIFEKINSLFSKVERLI